METPISGLPAGHWEVDDPRREAAGGSWRSIYRLGAAAALITVLVASIDIVLSILPGPTTPEPGRGSATDWFRLLQDNWFMGIRGLGILNVVNCALAVPLFLALYGAHRRASGAIAGLATIIVLIGATIYIANNAALPMLSLAGQYAAATSDAEKSLLVAVGQGLLARSEDFRPGSFTGFVILEIGEIGMAFVMLRCGIFSRLVAGAGILGFALLTIFTVWATFISVFYEVAMMVAGIGGISSLLWSILVARRLFQLSVNDFPEAT